MTLFGDFFDNGHRGMHKWSQYFPAYERHMERFRNRHVTLFEIGVGQGGSLQQWKRYLGPFAIVVGLDIYPRTKQVEEEQIHVRIGPQTDRAFLNNVIEEFGPPDIVIDDGSHLQPHVNATFDHLYPKVAKNGLYIVEDLQVAYHADHGGGVRYEGSFIEKAKLCIDEMHYYYAQGKMDPTELGDRTTSIHFYNGIVVFEVGERRGMSHRTTGNPALFNDFWAPPGETRESYDLFVDRTLKDMEKAGNPRIVARPALPPASQQIQALEREIAMLRDSTSWRITEPLRSLGRLFRREKPAERGGLPARLP